MQHTGTLSGGNQQKVCIARALVMGPRFLFVSEPTRGIDIGAKKLVLETLVRLNREQGMTIVIVSSELQELKSISDRIAIISEGQAGGHSFSRRQRCGLRSGHVRHQARRPT